jgi:ABC-2 type transport system permease protein
MKQKTMKPLPAESPYAGSLRRIKALIIKESYQIIYDPSSILISVVLPIILLFLYGFGVSLDINNLRVGLVLEDTAPDAQSFAKSLTDSRYFEITTVRDRRELIDPLLAGSIRGFVVVPSYFSAFRLRPDVVAPIQVITDGSEPNTANFVQNYVTQAWGNWLQQEKISNNLQGLPLINLQPRFWYNEELESRNFLVPGSLAIIMTLIGALLTALVIAREWERGTMESIMSTPVHIVEILIGKMVPYFCMGMMSMFFCVVGSILIYNVPLRGSILVLALLTAVFLLTALGMGLLISTLTKNQLAASQATMVVAFLPSYILSGFLFEIASMPYPIQLITYLVPARYFVRSLLSIFLVGNVWFLIFKDILAMLILASIVFFVTSRLIVKRLD